VPTLFCANAHDYLEMLISYVLLRFVGEFHFGNFFVGGAVQFFADDVRRKSRAQQRVVE
jgi:hypothetical protein